MAACGMFTICIPYHWKSGGLVKRTVAMNAIARQYIFDGAYPCLIAPQQYMQPYSRLTTFNTEA
jgi:hypothetical protein